MNTEIRWPRSVLHVTSEVAPFSQTGGLGDVTRDLPQAQRAVGVNAVVISPLYRSVDRTELNPMGDYELIKLGHREFTYRLWSDPNSTHQFVEIPNLIDRPNLYHDARGPYSDNALRFGVFCKIAAVLSADFDIVHQHDWQAGLVSLYLQGSKPTVFTIHNLAYQGLFEFSWVDDLEIPHEALSFEGMEFYSQLSALKAGVLFSNRTTTVSPTYSKEILTEPGGQGLSGLFSKRQNLIDGILNGIDTSIWDPSTDTTLPTTFDLDTLDRRIQNRRWLHTQAGLTDGTLMAVICRATPQKGLDLLVETAKELTDAGARFVCLTNGDDRIMSSLMNCEKNLPGRFKVFSEFRPKLARQIYGSSDFVLVPSRFEPCGLSQMMGMRYGAVPIVRATGGLADTVHEPDTGIVFRESTKDDFFAAVMRGLDLFRDNERYTAVQRNAMAKDVSWRRAQLEYVKTYQKARDSWGQVTGKTH